MLVERSQLCFTCSKPSAVVKRCWLYTGLRVPDIEDNIDSNCSVQLCAKMMACVNKTASCCHKSSSFGTYESGQQCRIRGPLDVACVPDLFRIADCNETDCCAAQVWAFGSWCFHLCNTLNEGLIWQIAHRRVLQLWALLPTSQATQAVSAMLCRQPSWISWDDVHVCMMCTFLCSGAGQYAESSEDVIIQDSCVLT